MGARGREALGVAVLRPASAARRLRAALVLLSAAAVAAYAIHFHTLRPGTAFRTVNADPEIAYFVGSVAVWDGQPYSYVQHPGTPVLVLGTAIVAVAAAFVPSAGSVPATFVGRPELFFVPAHFLLLAAGLAVVLALGWKTLAVRRPSDAVLAAALALSYFALFPGGFRWAFYWSHNAFAFSGGAALWLAVLAAQRRGRPLTTRAALLLGLGAGALVATQLLFATWAVGVAVAAAAVPLMRDGRRGSGEAVRVVLGIAAGAVFGFVLCFLPTIGHTGAFLDFMRALLTHQGAYGGGPAGFASAALLRANLATLWGYAPSLFVAEILAIVAVLAALRGQGVAHRGWRAAGIGLVVQWPITVFLISKHPSPFYLPALAALFPPLLAVAFVLWRGRGGPARIACVAAASVVLAATAVNLARTVADDGKRNAFRAAMDGEVAEHRRRAAAARGVTADEVVILWGPGVRDAGCYALWMGTQYSANALAGEISRACPSEGLLWTNVVVVPEGWGGRGGVPALVVTSESLPRVNPFFAALGTPEIGSHPDTEGLRLAFFDVTLDAGRVVPAPLSLREVP